jgi:putative zinc finger protein
MTCDDAREQLSALIDDALGAEKRGAVEAHLATCADCRRELERLRGTVALLHAVVPARAPAGFVDRVLEAARPEPWPRRLVRALFLPWPVKLPVEAAAIVLVAVGVAYVFRTTPGFQQTSRLEYAQPAPPVPRGTAPAPSSPDAGREAMRSQQAALAHDKDQAPDREKKQKPETRTPEQPAPKVSQETQAFSEVRPRPKEADERRAKLDDASRDVAKRQANVPPTTPAEPPIAGKLEASPPRAERAPGATSERARSSAAPAPERRADAPQGPGLVGGTLPMAPLVSPDVFGRLAVTDPDAALRNLALLLTRLGGVENRRYAGQEGPLIELTIPRDAYAEFLRELARLGRWQLIGEPPTLPEKIRVTLRITS